MVATVACAGVALAACGSTPSSSGAAGRSSSAAGSAVTGSSAPASTSSSAGASSGSTASSGTAPGTPVFPAVSNATDLSVEPKPAAGTSPPPSTLQTRDLVVGTGATASATSTVTVRYVGANYATGKIFDASWTDPGGPTATFSLTGTVQGFGEGIAGMKVGGRREIVIPPALGYPNGSGSTISVGETLVFVVDLLAVH